jgi:hypothetical protein
MVDVACNRPGTRIVPTLERVHPVICDTDRLVRPGELGCLVDASLIILATHTSCGETSDAFTVASIAAWFEIDPKTTNRHCAESGFVIRSALRGSGRMSER